MNSFEGVAADAYDTRFRRLTMGRWREMDQREVDILSAEVGLAPQALPAMKEKVRDKLDRLQRKSAKPVEVRAKRVLRPARDEAAGETARPARAPRSQGGEQRPQRAPRKDSGERREGGRGTPVAERPSDVKKRQPRPAVELADRPARKQRPATPNKRPPAGDGQRPGFGRKR